MTPPARPRPNVLPRLLGLGFLLPSAAAAALTLHVDPAGRDEWTGANPSPAAPDGTGPLQNVARAVERARARREQGPVTIRLAEGRYPLAETLRLGPDDSGLTIEGVPRGGSVLSGGRRLTGWSRDATDPRRWSVTLPEVAAGRWYFRQLFLDGRRLQRARHPDTGYFQAAGPLGQGSPIVLPFRPGDLTPGDTRRGVELLMLQKWTDLHLPIRAVDTQAHTAVLPGGPRPAWMDEPDARYWIENSAAALNLPGEWRVDPETGRVELIAPDETFHPDRAMVVAPRLETLVRWEGRPEADGRVRGVTLRRLRFAEADYPLPADGLISPQAAVDIHGTLRADFAVDGRLEECTVENAGGYGLDLGRGCQRWAVVGNIFQDLGAGGVRVGEPSGTDDPLASTHTTAITDNQLLRLGRIFPPAVGILVFRSGTNRIAHNDLRDLYYTGISVGWNWGYQDNPCRANVIEFNRVEKIGQGMLSDMGGIYTLGPQPGTIIRHNLFRDIESYRYGGWGLYTDEGSTGILLENNVAYRCRDAGFHQHYGRDNVVRRNVLAFNRNHAVMRTRTEDHRSFWFTNNVVVADSGDLLGSNWQGDTNQFWSDGNLWFDTRHGTNRAAYRMGRGSWADWQARGLDPNSQVADPQFVDPRRPELGFRRGSPAAALGFNPRLLERVGPRPPARRD